MLKNVRPYRIRAICLLMIALGLVLGGCSLDRQVFLESGSYIHVPNSGAAGSIKILEVDRGDQQVALSFGDGASVIVSIHPRDRSDWPSGCPTNISSTYMEVLDIVGGPLTAGELTFEDPILVRDCPAEPEQIALREDGVVGGGGSACANTNKCFHFARQPEGAAVLMAPIVNAKPLPSSMKGYELYSWYDLENDSWLYTLITGTNRLKTVEEIIAEENQVTQTEWVKITTAGTEALKAALRRVPPGTELFWLDGERLEGVGELTANITLPEATVVENIDTHCRQLDIQLHTSQ